MRGISLYQSMLHEKLVPHEITSSNLADLMFELGEFYLKVLNLVLMRRK